MFISSTEPENDSAGAQSNVKKFDYFYRRSAFRQMTEFYKGVFRPVLDKWRERKQVSTYVREFRKKKQLDDIEIKFRDALEHTFETYTDGTKFFKEPAHDLDKLTLKSNSKK